MLRSEDTVCLSDIGTVRICYCGLICHIVDEDSVHDIRIYISHVQREWSTPGDVDGCRTTLNCDATGFIKQSSCVNNWG